jgi:hypothetical protein
MAASFQENRQVSLALKHQRLECVLDDTKGKRCETDKIRFKRLDPKHFS